MYLRAISSVTGAQFGTIYLISCAIARRADPDAPKGKAFHVSFSWLLGYKSRECFSTKDFLTALSWNCLTVFFALVFYLSRLGFIAQTASS